MKYGIREICDVVLKAKSAMKVGNKVFYKNEPVIYFDTLKTSTLEGASSTVYANGGRGNARLVAWEGERTVTFTMEDALISQTGLMILTGAGLIEATSTDTLKVHTTEVTDEVYPVTDSNGNIESVKIYLTQKPYLPASGTITGTDPRSAYDYIYVMLMKDGEIITEPYIPNEVTAIDIASNLGTGNNAPANTEKLYEITLSKSEGTTTASDNVGRTNSFVKNTVVSGWDAWSTIAKENVVFVDYYVEKSSGAYQIDITPETFGGNFYLEASTLFRTENGVDMPAEFIIPNCKVQSNFTFNMAATGDPSTFTFTMDAFPDYTRFNKRKKVLAAIQVIDTGDALTDLERLGTPHDVTVGTGNSAWIPYETRLQDVDSNKYPAETRSQKGIIEQDGRGEGTTHTTT